MSRHDLIERIITLRGRNQKVVILEDPYLFDFDEGQLYIEGVEVGAGGGITAEGMRDILADTLVAGTNVTITNDDPAPTVTVSVEDIAAHDHDDDYLLLAGGTVTGTLTAPLRDAGGQVYNVKAYGAVGNGLADDTDAIAATITAAESAATTGGGTVYFPPGVYMTSSELVMTVPLYLVGAGYRSSKIMLVDGSSDTTDLIRIRPPASADAFEASGIFDLGLEVETAGDGRDIVRIDLVGGSRGMSRFYLHRCHLGDPGHYSIFLNAGTVAAPANTPSFFLSRITENEIRGGISLVASADSLDIIGNNIGGTKGVVIAQETGASNMRIMGNTFTNAGFLTIDSSHKMIIAENYFEATGATVNTPHGALIDLQGDSGTVSGTIIHNNTIIASPTADAHGIYVADPADATDIDGNHFLSAGTGRYIVIAAGATDTIVGPRNIASGGGFDINLTDAGTNTTRVIRRNDAVWNPGSIANGAAEIAEVFVNGASVGDPCFAGLSSLTNSLNSGYLLSANAVATNTVWVTLANHTGAALDPGSGTLRIICMKGG